MSEGISQVLANAKNADVAIIPQHNVLTIKESDIIPDDVIIITPEDIVAEPFSQEEYEKLKNGFTRWRDLLFCKFLRTTGLRVSEALAIRPYFIKEDGPRTFTLVKREKKRTKEGVKQLYERVYLHPQVDIELKNYISGNHIDRDKRIFPFTRRRIEQIFNEVGLKTLGRRVHPHEMRHFYIQTLFDGGVPAEAAAKLVGHESSKTTEKYYYKLSADKRAEIQRRMPV